MSSAADPARLVAFASALVRLRSALDQPKTEWTRDAGIRAAARLGWIADDLLWLEMLEDRNRTTHTYNDNEALAEAIYSRLPAYRRALEALCARLSAV